MSANEVEGADKASDTDICSKILDSVEIGTVILHELILGSS